MSTHKNCKSQAWQSTSEPQHRQGRGEILALSKSQDPLGYTVNESLSQKKLIFSFKIEYLKFIFEFAIINFKMQFIKYEDYQMLPYLYLLSL